jgi:hypothetical protein
MTLIDTARDAPAGWVLPESLRDRLTIPLWPDAGQLLDLSRGSTYQAAQRGEIPGLLRIGSRWVVSVPALLKALDN